jgi:predicted nucleotidyltransferase component of viral defense system
MKILTKLQLNFLKAFFKAHLKTDFFLTGGTALAEFYLQHRLSEDIDLFTTNQEVNFTQVNVEIIKIINFLQAKIKHQVLTPSFIQYILQKNDSFLKIDVVKDTLPHFGKIKKIGEIQVDSLENISVGKLLALFGRADAKDFIDLYFILKVEKKFTFEKIFNLAKKKDKGLEEFYLADMMTKVCQIKYFPKTLKPIDQKDLINFYLELSKKIFNKIKPKED